MKLFKKLLHKIRVRFCSHPIKKSLFICKFEISNTMITYERSISNIKPKDVRLNWCSICEKYFIT